MIKILGKSWQRVAAVMLAVVMLAMPAIAGIAAANVSGLAPGNESLKYNELKGAELNQLTQRALDDKDVKALLNELLLTNPKVTKSSAAEYKYNGKKGRVLILTFEADKEVHLIYSVNSKGKTKVGAGVVQTINGNKKIEVFDVGNGNVYHTSTIDVVNGEPLITWREGPFVPTKELGTQEKVNPASSSSCSKCLSICNKIMGYGGCTFTGYFVCLLVCGPEGTVLCGLICAILYAIICGEGTSIGCYNACRDIGYCP